MNSTEKIPMKSSFRQEQVPKHEVGDEPKRIDSTVTETRFDLTRSIGMVAPSSWKRVSQVVS